MPKRLQAVLGANLARLMKASPEFSSPKKLAARVGTSKSTIERIRAGTVAAQIDTLARIARVFELQAWQLLIDDLDPGNPPLLRQEDEKLKQLYRSLKIASEKLAEYQRNDPN